MPRDKGPLLTKEDVDVSPLQVQNPRPSSSTYTFLSEMTHLSFSSTNPVPTATQDNTSPQPSSSSFRSTPPASPVTPDDPHHPSTSMSRARPHGKKRHPSYIPRPPNAFILFRSAFIRLCWKKLSAEQRSHWEAQAVIAQAEHRAKYPDWRFSPGSNAQVKREHKEASASGNTRKKTVRSRLKNTIASVEEETEDGPEDSVDMVEDSEESSKTTDGKGKGKAKSTSRAQSFEDKRYQKIAGFVAEGLKGDELDMALKQWEMDKKVTRPAKPPVRSKSIRGTQARSSLGSQTTSSHARSRSDNILSKSQLPSSPLRQSSGHQLPASSSEQQDTDAPDGMLMDTSSSPSILSNVPLTHMYKRSTSAPASHNRLDIPPSSLVKESPSEDEGNSSGDDPPSASLSPTSVEHSPGTWKPLEVIVLKEATSEVSLPPTGPASRSHSRPQVSSTPNQSSGSRSRSSSTINTFPSVPPRSSPNVSSSPRDNQLTWQDTQNQRRLDDIQEPITWWSSQRVVSDPTDRETQSSAGGSPALGFMDAEGGAKSKERSERVGLTDTAGMGYAISGATNHYSSSGYIEPFRSYEPVPDGSQRAQWTDISQVFAGRTGLVTVIDDPYADDCTPIPISTPRTFVPDPLSSGESYYRPPTATPRPNQGLPASSFSTLSGWAGEYNGKFHSHAWGEAVQPHQLHTIQPHPTSSQTDITHQQPHSPGEQYPQSPAHPWYSQQNDTWTGTLQHAPMAITSQDWDRMEYRAATEMQSPSGGTPRSMSFIDESRQSHL
ncbi:hypothetical protein CVT24_003492 [Panaeolus cyanescens]|uniref:HMG box domain-containing protein n=1 Tax=Panaeolus cyanescens TaxID=181874 RepID=A0A409Y7M6_9AGAR|nr:hypothetical protein CVT24_003492 [Panaeolus cyanescens]